jgi:2-dehydro-3-deoxyphosphogluconate aldolase/(4S)-4-hydroxy-2-oxoglutarate aldolase
MSHHVFSDRSQTPIVPVITFHDLADVAPLTSALVESGLTTLEITLRTEVGIDAIREVRILHPQIVIGAGTVTTPDDAARASAAGAEFLISPGFSPAVLESAAMLGIPFIPGVATASELQHATSMGVDLVKLFPVAHIGGIDLLGALASVWPAVRFVPTGGITQVTASTYLQHPAVAAVGGSWMIPQSAITAREWVKISELAVQANNLTGSTQ